jgi:hypothetical protein
MNRQIHRTEVPNDNLYIHTLACKQYQLYIALRIQAEINQEIKVPLMTNFYP